MPFRLFLSSAPEDDELREAFARHLKPLERTGQITVWHAGLVDAGTERGQRIAAELERASVILVLLSAHYLASDD